MIATVLTDVLMRTNGTKLSKSAIASEKLQPLSCLIGTGGLSSAKTVINLSNASFRLP